MTAIKTQLKEQYLENNHCQHGLYLIGCFNCDEWNEEDYRKKEASKWSLQEMKLALEDQAKALSDADIHIDVLILDTSFL